MLNYVFLLAKSSPVYATMVTKVVTKNCCLHSPLVAMPPVVVFAGSHDPVIAVIVPVTSDMLLL